jgi:BCD family chlorophyll transporter-like MFS transporter
MTESATHTDFWRRYGPRLLPFADAASADLPLSRILRLALFQVGAGITFVLLNGTLNRVMIVELGITAALVSLLIALPLVIAPFRALIGFRSDKYSSYLGWRRVPFLFIGSMLQFGGLALLPFSLILLSGDTHWPAWFAQAATALSFLLVGVGMHTVQTAGLALATDIAPVQSRTRVVALLYVMLLVGMVFSSMLLSQLLQGFSQIKLIQILQGTAVLTLFLNLAAVWKQERAQPAITRPGQVHKSFRHSWAEYLQDRHTRRFLWALAFGTAAFSMQDILLEPYGGQVLALDVAATTLLTAVLVGGTLLGFALAARSMQSGGDPCRIAAYGVTLGLFAFAAVVFSAPFGSAALFRTGTFLIGLAAGLFSVSMLAAEMMRRGNSSATSTGSRTGDAGLALGAWGAVQATAAGVAILVGGSLRDLVSYMAQHGWLGTTLNSVDTGYLAVYLLEIVLLFVALAVLGPLTGRLHQPLAHAPDRGKSFGLIAFPG